MIEFLNKNALRFFFAILLLSFIIPPFNLSLILLILFLTFNIFKNFYTNTSICNKKVLLDTPIFYFLIYFLLLLLSLAYTDNLQYGYKLLIKNMLFVLIPIILSSMQVKLKKEELLFVLRFYVRGIVLIFFVLLFIAIAKNAQEGYTLSTIIDSLLNNQYSEGSYKYLNYWYFTYDKFCEPLQIQPIYLGLYANIAIVFLLSLKYYNVKFKYYKFSIISVITFLILISSRWQLLITLFLLVLYLFFFSKMRISKKIILSMFSVVAILVISYLNPVSWKRINEVFENNPDFTKNHFGGTSLRIIKWNNAIEQISKEPLLGYGIGDAKDILLEAYKKNEFYIGYYNKYNAHNQFLDTTLQIGLLGLIILCSILFYSFYHAVRKNNTILVFLSTLFFFSFITESILNRQWGLVSFVFFITFFSQNEFRS